MLCRQAYFTFAWLINMKMIKQFIETGDGKIIRPNTGFSMMCHIQNAKSIYATC